jgi:predicted component of type VI protein secretion system
MLSADEAATVAAKYHLSIADAASLRQLADDPAEADALASKFASSDDPRGWVRELFRDDEQPTPAPAPAPPPPAAAAVPREGGNAQPAETGEHALRTFVRNLFR